ncbi:MFS transporter [Chitinivibrio alkaliphilus]|uniref:MFS transporter n=1 Tax=Chitinivibrio alkaliphilus TaxID=1505232 RepID=UPI00040E67AD|nr:MFS transporter [Chitinivibrio alkaliphilus]
MNEQIQKEAFVLKQSYFVLFFVMGLVAPFASIFFKHVLVDDMGNPADGKIKIIMTAVPLVAFLGNIVTGIISDKLQLGRRIVTILCGLSVFPAIVVGMVGESFFMDLPLTNRFYILAFSFLLYNLFAQPINPLLDSETLGFLNRHSHRSKYGRFRFWGTLGWAVITVSIGAFLTYVVRDSSRVIYSYNFYFAAFFFALLVVLSFLSRSEARPQPVKIPWGHLRKDRSFFAFLFFIFCTGIINNGISMQYMGYYLEDVTNTPFEIGMMFGFWTVLEFPVMLKGEWLMKNLGNRKLMIMGLLLTSLKLYLFSLFTNETPFVYKFLAVLIHGPAFSFYFLALIDYVDHRAHRQMRATYMSITTIVRSTLAGAAGGWVCGEIIEHHGARQLMSVGAVGALVMTVYFILLVKDSTDEKKFDF